MEQICSSIGIAPSTFYRYKTLDKELSEAHKKGMHQGIENVANALYQSAIDGNLGAQVFYLKNRDRDRWKDKWDLEHTGDVTHTITVVETGCPVPGPVTDGDANNNT